VRLAALVFLAPVVAGARPYAPTQDFCVREPAHPAVFVSGKQTIACFSPTAECLQLGEDDDDRKPVLHPPVVAGTPADVSEAAGALRACSSDGTCKPLGKRATVAVRAAIGRGQLGDEELSVTADLATVIVRNGDALELWNVAKDRAVKARGPAKAALVDVDVVGSVILTTWSDGMGRINDPLTGKARGTAFFAGHAFALGGDRIAVVPEGKGGRLTVLAAKTGKQLAAVELGPQVAASAAVVSGTDELAVSWSVDGKKYQVARVSLVEGQEPRLGTVQSIEACKL
jgi:hypothetical protein